MLVLKKFIRESGRSTDIVMKPRPNTAIQNKPQNTADTEENVGFMQPTDNEEEEELANLLPSGGLFDENFLTSLYEKLRTSLLRGKLTDRGIGNEGGKEAGSAEEEGYLSTVISTISRLNKRPGTSVRLLCNECYKSVCL